MAALLLYSWKYFRFFCQRDVQNGIQSEIVGDEEKSRTGGRVVFSQMNWHGRVRQDQTNNTMELIEWGGGGRMGGIYTTVGGIE